MTLRLGAISGVVLVLVAACSSAAQPPAAAPSSEVVATVGARTITLAEVDARAMQVQAETFAGLTMAQALYEARRGTLDDMIFRILVEQEATTLGVTPETLVDREILGKAPAPTDAEIAAWYTANPARVEGAPLEQVREPIRGLLVQERQFLARQQYMDRLKTATPVTISLPPPRITVTAAGRPMKGPETAPIEIIEFSDFECPYCLRSLPTIARVLEAYGDRVRLVYRHYPLAIHPNARPAAEASLCAAEQNQFWPYHDRLFENQTTLSVADLKAHAAAIGLDAAQFNACVDTRKYRTDVDTDMAAAEQAGVTGTPAFFINGRPLGGAQPFEAFKAVIDEELARAQQPAAQR